VADRTVSSCLGDDVVLQLPARRPFDGQARSVCCNPLSR
jgi:hypothetical protein